MPFDGASFDDMESLVRICAHYFCTLGMQFVMSFGKKRWKMIRDVSMYTATMPFLQNHGKPSHAEIKVDDPRVEPL